MENERHRQTRHRSLSALLPFRTVQTTSVLITREDTFLVGGDEEDTIIDVPDYYYCRNQVLIVLR